MTSNRFWVRQGLSGVGCIAMGSALVGDLDGGLLITVGRARDGSRDGADARRQSLLRLERVCEKRGAAGRSRAAHAHAQVQVQVRAAGQGRRDRRPARFAARRTSLSVICRRGCGVEMRSGGPPESEARRAVVESCQYLPSSSGSSSGVTAAASHAILGGPRRACGGQRTPRARRPDSQAEIASTPDHGRRCGLHQPFRCSRARIWNSGLPQEAVRLPQI